MRTRPLRLGLYLNHLLSWQGGREYARNLLLSLRAYRESESRRPFHRWSEIGALEIHLFVVDTLAESDLAEFRPLAHAVHSVPDAQWETTNRIVEALQREKMDAAFPIHSRIKSPVYTVDWIFDLQHRRLPHFFTPDDIARRDRSFDEMLTHAWRVVVSSEATKRDVQRFYPGHDDTVRVLPFATFPNREWIAPDPEAVVRKYHLPKRYFMVSSQLWLHKNHALVFRAVKLLLDQGIEVDVVCTGPLNDYRRPRFLDETLDLIHQSGVFPRVRLMGLMPRLDQLQVMRRALAVIQPSLFEGWSTVLEDARILGKKVLCSSLDVHREQNLPEAEYFSPDDAPELARLMAQVWKSDRPSFDPAAEAKALARAEERTIEFARAFCEIALRIPLVHRHFWHQVGLRFKEQRRRIFGRKRDWKRSGAKVLRARRPESS